MPDLQRIYAARFEEMGLERRARLWAVLCRSFFDELIGKDRTVLDLGCGYGEFINAVQAKEKLAVDLNPDARDHLAPDVRFHETPATDLSMIPAGSIDVVFTSNFLEHLHDKSECDKVFAEVRRILRPDGRFILMGPNVHYAYKEYWDYYDHHLPLSHLSVAEGLRQAGFATMAITPRFLPYSMNSSLPSSDFLVRAYLAFPLAWRLFGKQFLVVAQPVGKGP